MLSNIIFYLHVLGAIMMGFYILFPFLLGKLKTLPAAGQSGYLRAAYHVNFVSQFTIIAQLITGGYLISVAHVSTVWMIVVLVLFVAIGACMGMLSGKLRRTSAALAEGKDVPNYAGTMSAFAYTILVLFIVILIFMIFPNLL